VGRSSSRSIPAARQGQRASAGETKAAKLLAWIEPTADGVFKAVIMQTQSDSSTASTQAAQEFPTFGEAGGWVEGTSISLRREIRWMS
jgi:carboxylesterase type B